MLKSGAGTILFTGATASLRGGAGFANLASPKFGLRAVAQSLARELDPQGIHVAHVIIDGQIHSQRYAHLLDERGPDSLLEPNAIADAYLAASSPASQCVDARARPAAVGGKVLMRRHDCAFNIGGINQSVRSLLEALSPRLVARCTPCPRCEGCSRMCSPGNTRIPARFPWQGSDRAR